MLKIGNYKISKYSALIFITVFFFYLLNADVNLTANLTLSTIFNQEYFFVFYPKGYGNKITMSHLF